MGLITNLRQPKLFNIAIFDVVATALVAFASQKYYFTDKTFPVIFLCLLVIGIAVHVMMGTPTMLNAYIGLNTKQEVLDAREAALAQP